MQNPVRRATAMAAGIAASVLITAPSSSAQESPPTYVALGDSSAAGPLIPDPDPNIACAKSTSNYPNVAAERLGAELTDATCSGAKLGDLAGRQFGFLPPQYAALRPDTDLVTLSIGGNDVGLVQAALSCINLAPEPAGMSCADRFTEGGADPLAEAVEQTRAEFAAALDEIELRSPDAQIVVTGYGTYVRPGGCHPQEPIWGKDADYIQGSVDGLSAMIEDETVARGHTYLDFAAISEGHDICADPEEKFYEGLVPTSFAAPLHPNAAGMAAFGAAVADVADETTAENQVDSVAHHTG